MHLQRLSLTNYRNYTRLELTLPLGLTIVQGQNGQGKSNLLEAITLLATSRSPRTASDAEMVSWVVRDEPYPFARLSAELTKSERLERLDITLTPVANNGGFRKQVRINGAPKRSLDLVGMMPVVLFRPEDVDLVAGSPGGRRRYLDIALCQIDPAYCRALAQYNKTLEQRNALLRNLQGSSSASSQLRFWNEKLVETGSVVVARRQWLILALEREATLRHLDFSGGFERLKLRYLASFDPGHAPGRDHNPGRGQPPAAVGEEGVRHEDLTIDTARASFLAHLHANQARDLAAGMTLLGPHRDDMGFFVSNHNLRSFGSRGQQRTAALATKMAEVAIMTNATGAAPLLLLDDVMSELDANRRAMLLEALESVPQAIVTTTDWHHFSLELQTNACRLHVDGGRLNKMTAPQA